jgi:RimJ/RimL family protein N-acetyltransferase
LFVGNERARRFYEIDGWQPDGTGRREEIWGAVVDEIRFRRPLP